MSGDKNGQRLPDGKCHGRDLPDRGVSTGVEDTYGAGKGGLKRGYTDRQGISNATKSDK